MVGHYNNLCSIFPEHKRKPDYGFATALKFAIWFLLSLTARSSYVFRPDYGFAKPLKFNIYCDIITEPSDTREGKVSINKHWAENNLLSGSTFLDYTSSLHAILTPLSFAFLNIDQKNNEINWQMKVIRNSWFSFLRKL